MKYLKTLINAESVENKNNFFKQALVDTSGAGNREVVCCVPALHYPASHDSNAC